MVLDLKGRREMMDTVEKGDHDKNQSALDTMHQAERSRIRCSYQKVQFNYSHISRLN